MKLIFCGFMGAGKSQFVQKLKGTDKDFAVIDLDDYIFFNHKGFCHKILADLIDEVGLSRFRVMETEALSLVLNLEGNHLIALGGGALEAENNQRLIENNPDTVLVWLDTPWPLCLERIKGDDSRPLARDLSDSSLHKKYQLRLKGYKRAKIHLDLKEQEEMRSVRELLNHLVK